jgi:starch synthase
MRPLDPDRFELNLAGAINALMADASTREVMGRAGRRRAVESFSWASIARQTLTLYESLVGAGVPR